MITDDLFNAAHAEAQRQYQRAFPLRNDPAVVQLTVSIVDSVLEMVESHLDAQEPTDDEVDAVHMATHGLLSPATLRTALRAARDVRGQG